MRHQVWIALFMEALLATYASGQSASLSRQAIMERVVSMMRSRAYWQGVHNAFFGHYKVGKNVEGSLVRNANEAAVFMESAGANFVIQRSDSGEITGRLSGFSAHGTNDT